MADSKKIFSTWRKSIRPLQPKNQSLLSAETTNFVRLKMQNLNRTMECHSLLLFPKAKLHTEEYQGKKHGCRLIVDNSPILGKAKDFLGVFSEANKRLEDDAKDNAKEYDIEALTGSESEYIEMDLMLGVADLHTPEAVAAAEFAIAGYQPVISLAASSSSDDDDDDSDDSDKYETNGGYVDGEGLACSPTEMKKLKPLDGDRSTKPFGNGSSKKRPKIVELP